MLKPTCAFIYVFQVVSVTDEGACVELSAVLGDGVADGDGDCVLPASELQDANRIAKMRKMYCFLIKTPLEVFLASAAQRFAFAKHGAGASVDSAWEQKKLEARKMLVNRAESPASSALSWRLPRSLCWATLYLLKH